MKAKFRLKIAPKFALGFGIVLISVLASYIVIYQMLIKNRGIIESVTENVVPSMTTLNNCSFMILETKGLIKYWVQTQSDDNIIKKIKLRKIVEEEYPKTKIKLKKLSKEWDEKAKVTLDSILNQSDILVSHHKKIMLHLDKFNKYNNLNLIANLKIDIDEGNPMMRLTDSLIVKLNYLRSHEKAIVLEKNADIKDSFDSFTNMIIASGFILLFMIVSIAILLARSFSLPVDDLRKLVFSMNKGELPKYNIEVANDEIGNMGTALSGLITGLKNKAGFASEIGKGKFDSELTLAGKNDVLGNSLIQMRESLSKASKEAELRRTENQQRSWSSQGLTEFNEIIREQSGTLEEFTSIIISKLTKYMKAQLGGLYIINDDNQEHIYLELTSFYAYDRHKFITKKIELGENLVGQCVLEKDTIFITDIPEDYVHISSGLGQDNPKSLLIVPLKLNEGVYGVVELASFNVFENYQIEFVEKAGEIFASTISNIKTNIQTAKLLEDSNEKSEKLAKQEAESKKDIARLQAKLEVVRDNEKVQIANYKKIENEYKNTIVSYVKKIDLQEKDIKNQTVVMEETLDIINSSIGTIEIDFDGKMFQPNKLYLATAEISLIELAGKTLHSFFYNKDIDKLYKILYNLQNGISYRGVNQYVFKDKNKWLYETFIPIKDFAGNYYKSVISSIDVTGIINNEI